MDIGADVRKRRKSAGLTQQNLADLMGWTEAMVSKTENNKRVLGAVEYLKIIELLSGVRKIAKFTIQGPVLKTK